MRQITPLRLFILSAVLVGSAVCPLDAAIHWLEHRAETGFKFAADADAADVDGDGDIDLLGAAWDPNEIIWVENLTGDGTAWSRHVIDGSFGGAFFVSVGDIDGDGDVDVVGAAERDHHVSWWENTNGDGTRWIEHAVDLSFRGAREARPADVDGDGDLDIVGAAWNSDDVSWWENTIGDGTDWDEHFVDGFFDGATSVYPADVDGDGDIDILGSAAEANDVTWWENRDGSGTVWREFTIDTSFSGASSVHAADLDGDGDLDVLGSAIDVDRIAWWNNTMGDGTAWTKRTIDRDFNGALAVSAADLDGDGDLDVLGAAYFGGDVSWWENLDGLATDWSERSIDPTFKGATSIGTADVNSDGHLDVLGAAYLDKLISWWENRPFDRPQLRTIGSCPGEMSMTLTLASGNATVTVLGSADEGTSSVPSGIECAGLPLDLADPDPLTTFTTGPNGDYAIERVLTAEDCGLYLQAVDKVACETTNVAPLPVE